MSRSWTENQKDAISSRRGSIVVSAAAGSGKTAVLVERVIQRLTDSENPTSADRLLIVTFTKAAAGEMLERITAAVE
ncbi:MAG: UvrD-helicase domain-containing protein, partial [Clostridia bacterium]|nr:UvrD-helicase domain-containing protein [Clostridia bacterium]